MLIETARELCSILTAGYSETAKPTRTQVPCNTTHDDKLRALAPVDNPMVQRLQSDDEKSFLVPIVSSVSCSR